MTCLQGSYTGYDQSYGSYGSGTDQQGSVPAAVANAAQSLPAESQQKLANIVAKVSYQAFIPICCCVVKLLYNPSVSHERSMSTGSVSGE